jgi:hypothetical protein
MENTFHKNAKPLLGKRFGKLLVQQVMPKRSNGKVVYLCLCDCGKHHEVVSTVLRKGKSTHCGCSWPSVNKKHGMSKSREHKSWTSAIDRCRKSHRQHANYYDRGIYVCKEWKGKNGFSKFYEHIGSCPSPLHSLDRIDNNKGYDVGNVRWATRSQQSINRRPRMSVESFSDDVLLSEIKRRNLKLN